MRVDVYPKPHCRDTIWKSYIMSWLFKSHYLALAYKSLATIAIVCTLFLSIKFYIFLNLETIQMLFMFAWFLIQFKLPHIVVWLNILHSEMSQSKTEKKHVCTVFLFPNSKKTTTQNECGHCSSKLPTFLLNVVWTELWPVLKINWSFKICIWNTRKFK